MASRAEPGGNRLSIATGLAFSLCWPQGAIKIARRIAERLWAS